MQSIIAGLIIAAVGVVAVLLSLLVLALCKAASKEPPKPGDKS